MSTPLTADTRNRGLPVSPYTELRNPGITDTGRRRLPVSTMRELTTPRLYHRRPELSMKYSDSDSPYHRCAKSVTPVPVSPWIRNWPDFKAKRNLSIIPEVWRLSCVFWISGEKKSQSAS